MTRKLAEAVQRYFENPTPRNREIGMDLICEGHLEPNEVKRLAWAIERYYEKAAKGT